MMRPTCWPRRSRCRLPGCARAIPPARLPTVADIEAHEWTPQERAFVESWLAPQVIGSPETVRRRITELLAETGVAEFMATTNAPSAAARTRSYRLLAELAELPPG